MDVKASLGGGMVGCRAIGQKARLLLNHAAKKKKKKKDNTRGRNTSSFFFFPVGHEEMGYTLAGRKVFACLENFSSLDIVDDEDDG